EKGELFAHATEEAGGALRLHGVGVFDDTDGGGELRIFESGGEAGDGLRVGEVHRHAEDFLGEMVDTLDQTAAAGEHEASAEERQVALIIEALFEQLEGLAD